MPTPSLLIVPSRWKTGNPGKLYSQIPTNGNGDFNVTGVVTGAGNIGTRVNNLGYIESITTSGTPRLDYYTSSGLPGCPALLVEPSGTNGIRNNSMVGAVIGGALPANWSFGTGAGVSGTVTAVGTENGIPYIDLRISGAATATSVQLNIETANQIAALNGQVWTISSYLKTIASPFPPLSSALLITERTSGGLTSAQNTLAISLTSSLARYPYSVTLNGGPTTAFAQPRLSFSFTIGQSYDFTIRIGYPQMELGSVATSVIPTTTAQRTRNADVISVSGAVSGSIGQQQGTIYCEFAYFGQPVIRSGPIYLRQAGSRGLSINYSPSDSPLGIKFISRNDGGSTDLTIVSGALQIGTYYKIAIGYDAGGTAAGGSQANGVVAYVNGVQTAIGTFRVPDAAGLTEFRMYGANAGTDAEAFNGRIRAAALYTTRLSDADLMLLTMPGNNTYLPQAVWNNYLSRPGSTELPDCLYTRHADLLDV